MKRTTKTYQKLCDCCRGGGFMQNPDVPSLIQTVTCIVCKGTGTQTITEIIEED